MNCIANQSPLSMGRSRQEYWSELPFSSPGDLPNPGIEPGSPSGRFFTVWATREAFKWENSRTWLTILFLFVKLLIYLTVSGLSAASRIRYGITDEDPIFVMVWQISNCSMWDLVPWSGIKPRCPALAVWSLSHWITGKVPGYTLKDASRCWVNDGWRVARVKSGTPEGAWRVDRGRRWRWRGLGYRPRVWVSDQTLSSLTPSLSPKNSPLLWVLLWCL